MKRFVIILLLVVGCGATAFQASPQVVSMTLDACVRANAVTEDDNWHTFLKKKTWFECCIDSCDIACLPGDDVCLSSCQHKCWDGPNH